MMTKFRDFSLLALYCGFIFWLSHQPSLPAPMWFEHQDKLYHAGAYFILAFFTWRFLRHIISTPWLLAVVSLIFCSLYGISDEWHQSFVDGRSSDVLDWLADTVGAAIAIFILYKFTTRARFR